MVAYPVPLQVMSLVGCPLVLLQVLGVGVV